MIEWVVIASSVCLNIFLIWYTRSTLYNLLYLSENLGNLRDVVTDFKEHLRTVYELERFYGDPTLTDLLEHSNLVTVELDKYDEIFLLTEPIEQEVEPDEQEET
jgi:hypothetical protein